MAAAVYGLSDPGFGGDSSVYLDVAKNILSNGCVSTSDPASAACVPHWGGNQFPGYPLLITLVGLLVGLPPDAGLLAIAGPIIVLQSALIGAAVFHVGRSVQIVSGSPQIAFLCAMFAGFSPLHFAWTRWILTEATSITITLWVFSELMLCLHQNRLRIFPLAVALAAGFFVRYDLITLCAAVVVIGFAVHSPMGAVRRGAAIALIMAIPIVGWTLRNMAHGLSPYPMADYGVGTGRGQGYYDWLATWEIDLYRGAAAAFPFSNRNYSEIVLPNAAFLDHENELEIRGLLEELQNHDGEELPLWIDRRFHRLAEERRHREPLNTWIVAPMQRAVNAWLAPGYSYGWKIEFGESALSNLARGEWKSVVSMAVAQPGNTVAKAALFVFHLGLLAVFVISVASLKSSGRNCRIFLLSVAAFVIVRTLFIVLLGQSDPRLTVQAFAAIELALLWWTMDYYVRSSSTSRHETND